MTLPFAALIFFSCTINGSFQGLRSYYPESIKLSPDLFVHLDDGQLICDTEESYRHKVVIATAEHVKNCVQADSSVVYIWGAKCKGSVCKSLNESQEMANQARVNLFIVAEYYDAELMDLNYKINHPIIGVDTEYYKSEWTKTYLSKFLSELAEEKTAHSGGRFLVFVDGEMVGRFRTMESALGIDAN